MPQLVRLYIRNIAFGAAASAVFVALLIGLDVAHLQHLVLQSPVGWIAVLMLFVFNTLVFAGVQFGIAVMGMAEDDAPHGGHRAPDLVAIPVPVERAYRRR